MPLDPLVDHHFPYENTWFGVCSLIFIHSIYNYIYIHIPKIGVPQIVQNYIGHFSIETPGGLDNTSILGNLHL